jgi:uncharacterized protein (TIGR00304 family)
MAQNALILCDAQERVMGREWGWVLIAAGVFLIGASFFQSSEQVSSSFGGVLMIGPIPIVFGSSPEMAIFAMLLAVVLMILSVLLFWRRA